MRQLSIPEHTPAHPARLTVGEVVWMAEGECAMRVVRIYTYGMLGLYVELQSVNSSFGAGFPASCFDELDPIEVESE